MKLKFYLNNTEVVWDVEPDEYLAQALRRHGVLSIHIGCDEAPDINQGRYLKKHGYESHIDGMNKHNCVHAGFLKHVDVLALKDLICYVVNDILLFFLIIFFLFENL